LDFLVFVMYSIILCGGSGTRLWPLSRKNFPKQFLNLYSDKSLLQETFLRMRKLLPLENIILVTNKKNYFNVVNQIKEIERDFNEKQILTEPASLNTLPAITYAIKYLVEIKRVDFNEPIIVLPSDHYIGELEVYLSLLESAASNIRDNIGTIGITPTKAEIGYGYIKKGERYGNYYKVAEFVEKPDKEIAGRYLQTGQYVWNSGMYIFKIKTFIEELKKHVPEIYSLLIKPAKVFIEKFNSLPIISIDVGISERSDKMVVFEGNFSWSDIGSFDSLAEIIGESKNIKHVSLNSKNVFVHSASNRLIATSGVEDLIIIENNDSILIQKKGKSEDIRKIVEHLDKHNYKEAEHNLIVHRPWGKYEVLIEEPGIKAKKITVYPGAKLSLQCHYHRAEHWVVVKGMAKIVNGDKNIFLKENESTFIPALVKHRLENPGKTNLEIIEVQTGNYVEEDDIIRFDDVYDRG
jgi:mannose-1-phosphate guanylyltransferase/mannose-6-phosphate isomerase